jgi:hypothetical protein
VKKKGLSATIVKKIESLRGRSSEAQKNGSTEVLTKKNELANSARFRALSHDLKTYVRGNYRMGQGSD